jgi:hypothetical protein
MGFLPIWPINAIALPTPVFTQDEIQTTEFTTVLESISVLPDWTTLDPRRPKFLQEIIADELAIRWGSLMVLPVPALMLPIDVDPTLTSSTYQSFEDGGTNLVVTMQRASQHLSASPLGGY